MVACVAFGAILAGNGRLRQAVGESLDKLNYYGYEIVIEVDEQVQMQVAIETMERLSLPFDTVALRGFTTPNLIIDPRHATFGSWRSHMVEVDEKHRPLFTKWQRVNDAEKAVIACPVVQEPDEECVT